jgi:hypothetical protein
MSDIYFLNISSISLQSRLPTAHSQLKMWVLPLALHQATFQRPSLQLLSPLPPETPSWA